MCVGLFCNAHLMSQQPGRGAENEAAPSVRRFVVFFYSSLPLRGLLPLSICAMFVLFPCVDQSLTIAFRLQPLLLPSTYPLPFPFHVPPLSLFSAEPTFPQLALSFTICYTLWCNGFSVLGFETCSAADFHSSFLIRE